MFAEWRRAAVTRGGLVWFLRDSWPGAGWGVVDALGRPKAALWLAQARVGAPAVHLTDEGLDGLARARDQRIARSRSRRWWSCGCCGREATRPIARRKRSRSRAHGAISLSADGMLGYFPDSTAAYRFGPPRHLVIAVCLKDTAARCSGRISTSRSAWTFP